MRGWEIAGSQHPEAGTIGRGLCGPLAGATAGAAAALPGGTAPESAALCFLMLLAAGAISDRHARHSALLPFVGRLARIGSPLLAAAALLALETLTTLPGIGLSGLALVAVAAVAATLAAELTVRKPAVPRRRVTMAVLGAPEAADGLARELEAAGDARHLVRGWIEVTAGEEAPGRGGEAPRLGSLEQLRAIVEEQGIDLLLMTADAPRLRVFDELARSCLHLPVRLQELTSFYEDTFGHVPVAEINAAWFQYIAHPRYRASPPAAQRALDLVVASLALVVLSPLLCAIALVIRRDGGPVLFSQLRIGEGGRPFRIWKLRTMAVGSSQAWAAPGDARLTRVGRWLRRSHLDELPQLYNVLMGEMSLVGPRPEQPMFVERLESRVPFYSRRHLIKPGLTGWAQVRCGYAGSDVGSAWKVSHDLYYLKHRSLWLNLLILAETLRTVVADQQYTARPAGTAFILGRDRPLPENPQADWPAASVPATESA